MLLSWSLVNWKFLAILFFSEGSIDNRIERLCQPTANSWSLWLWWWIVLPLILTSLILFAFPWIDLLIFRATIKPKNLKREKIDEVNSAHANRMLQLAETERSIEEAANQRAKLRRESTQHELEANKAERGLLAKELSKLRDQEAGLSKSVGLLTRATADLEAKISQQNTEYLDATRKMSAAKRAAQKNPLILISVVEAGIQYPLAWTGEIF